MTSTEQIIQVFGRETRQLLSYVEGLPPEDLARATNCAGWEVRDILTHLTSLYSSYEIFFSRGLQGITSMPPSYTPALAGYPIDVWVRDSVISRRIALGEELVPIFRTECERLNSFLEGLSPEEWETASYHTRGITTIAKHLRVGLSEVAFHNWDIRSTLGTSPTLDPATHPFLIELFCRDSGPNWTALGFQPAGPLPKPLKYRVELTGITSEDIPKAIDIEIAGESFRIKTDIPGTADVTFRCDPETWIMVAFGRLGLDTAQQAGRMVIEGDRRVALGFNSWFRTV